MGNHFTISEDDRQNLWKKIVPPFESLVFLQGFFQEKQLEPLSREDSFARLIKEAVGAKLIFCIRCMVGCDEGSGAKPPGVFFI